MNKVYLLARIVHVVTGAFWFGTVAFTATFLMPSMAEAGPDAGKVMVAMRRRHFFEVVPAIASVTVVTGVWLYWRFTGGFSAEVMSTRGAMVFGTGGAVGITALLIGVHVMRANSLKAMDTVGKAMGLPDGPDKAGMMKTAQTHRAKAFTAARIVAFLLATTAALMALGHYV